LASGERLVVRLVEVEAYLGDGSDPAAHSHRGPTPRNRTMFEAPGRLYAYRIYGLHTCVNVVCGAPGQAAAVLLRAAEPIEGLETMRRLRRLAREADPRLATRGPARLAEALGLALGDDGRSLLRGRLTLHPPAGGRPGGRIQTGPRVGISQARDLPYRFFEADSPWVSAFRDGARRRSRNGPRTRPPAESPSQCPRPSEVRGSSWGEEGPEIKARNRRRSRSYFKISQR
jgi:DNA-3-methyladenine glycosylase